MKSLYQDFPTKTIEKYLREFEQGASQLPGHKLSYDALDKIIEQNFLVRESAPLQFSQVRTGVLYTNNLNDIVDRYFDLYFGGVSTSRAIKGIDTDRYPAILSEGIIKNAMSTIDRSTLEHFADRVLVDNFKNYIVSKASLNLKHLLPNRIIRNSKATFEPDLIWRNGTVNAVKGLSFDLDDAEKIIEKALLCNAKLNYLQEEAHKEGLRFDLLVVISRRSDSYNACESALSILRDIQAPKKIVTEENFEAYCDEVVNYFH